MTTPDYRLPDSPLVFPEGLFCVKTSLGPRQGYFLVRWLEGPMENNSRVHIIKPAKHQNRYYTINTAGSEAGFNPPKHTIYSRKSNGRVVRKIRWSITRQTLNFEDTVIPVLKILPASVLPSIKFWSFIPIVDNSDQRRTEEEDTLTLIAPLTEDIMNIPLNPGNPGNSGNSGKYTIESIPPHIISAILRDAVMQGEECPITASELDVSNGAVTSCFHLFEKNAIMKWLMLPESKEKCPVCNTPCNSYTL